MIKKEKDETIEIKTGSLENLARIYSNSVKLSVSLYDFQLIFGNSALDSLSENQQIVVQPQILIHMSPQHFKAMMEILNSHLKKYEETFGEIHIPQDSPAKEKKAQKN